MRKLLLILPLLLLTACEYAPEHPYAVAEIPTPVLYSKKFNNVFGGKKGDKLKFDDYGEIDELEFVALPGTVFTIEKDVWKQGNKLYRVTSADYPYTNDTGHFIDARFVKVMDEKPTDRPRQLPSYEQIMHNLEAANGSMYTWGGNFNAGIPELLAYYPPNIKLNPTLRDQWMLKGVDCSGLLYEATGGFTPRNTSSLVEYGEPVEIAGLTAEEMAAKLQPLDLIVWKGHLIIVIEHGLTIQSRLDYDDETPGQQAGGVQIIDLLESIEKTLEKRTPVNSYNDPVPEDKKPFVVRRWYKG